MPARLLRTIAVVALCLFDGALAVAASAPRHPPVFARGSEASSASTLRAPRLSRPARDPVAGRDAYVDPASPYKANRLSTTRTNEPILNVPGQTTVLTRQVLDDMKATSVRDALRSTAGVTVGR